MVSCHLDQLHWTRTEEMGVVASKGVVQIHFRYETTSMVMHQQNPPHWTEAPKKKGYRTRRTVQMHYIVT